MNKTGWTMSGLLALFLLPASIAPKLAGASVARDSMVALGWPAEHLFLIGLIELACLLLFLYPRTALLGAVLMTGLLGGALSSHLRIGSPLFSHTLFSIYLGLFMWVALLLRNAGLRELLRAESGLAKTAPLADK